MPSIWNETLGDGRSEPFIGAISGVPLLNFSVERRQTFLEGVLARLKPGAPLCAVLLRPALPGGAAAGVTVTQAAFVLFNLPPARVWVYRKA